MNQEIYSLLKELEDCGRAHDAIESDHAQKFLNLEPETAELISILARSSRAKHVLEIGTSNGYSTIWLATSISPYGGRVISIDRSSEKHAMARVNLERVNLSSCVDLITGEADEVLSTLPGQFDFVLFDADRVTASEQLKQLLPKLTPGALILADNVLSHPDQIAGYLAAIRELQLQHVVVPIGKGLSVALAG
jgi:predicted O-methyltransferase YrrM